MFYFLLFPLTSTTTNSTLSLHDALPISSSEKESCSEQICLFPARLTWQCALTQASTRFSFEFRFAPITSARHAWFSAIDRKSTRLNSSHRCISYAVFCLKKKNK